MLLEPGLEALLALSAALPLELHAVRGVDHVRRKELLDLLSEAGVGGRLGVQERAPDLLPGDPKLSEHLLAHQDRGELPLCCDVEDRTSVLPLGNEPRELALDDVETAGRVARDAVRVDDEEELFVPMLAVRDPMDVLVSGKSLVEALVGRSVHGIRCSGDSVPSRGRVKRYAGAGRAAGADFHRHSRQSIPMVRSRTLGTGGIRRLWRNSMTRSATERTRSRENPVMVAISSSVRSCSRP